MAREQRLRGVKPSPQKVTPISRDKPLTGISLKPRAQLGLQGMAVHLPRKHYLAGVDGLYSSFLLLTIGLWFGASHCLTGPLFPHLSNKELGCE